uniref:Uncharacterized protein n=1 Tax=Anguilla anguilla TaxID=7936 RepID=A0A0E9QDC6_ANGAN
MSTIRLDALFSLMILQFVYIYCVYVQTSLLYLFHKLLNLKW